LCGGLITSQNGKLQSPINIDTKHTVPLHSENELILNESVNVKALVEDNGHAIQINTTNAGKLTIHGKDYKLIQFHIHGKSEEEVNGKRYDLVAHMVHKSEDGLLAVIAVLFEQGEQENPMLAKVISHVGGNIDINPEDLLPKGKEHYFHFLGSLTTPPCSENVNWYVMKKVQSVTPAQLNAIRKYYNHNFRQIQPLNGREVESK
jgi:carbonic anhydrase